MVKGSHSFVGDATFTFFKEQVSCGGLRGVSEFVDVYRAFNHYTLHFTLNVPTLNRFRFAYDPRRKDVMISFEGLLGAWKML